jgi:hypothetical protein
MRNAFWEAFLLLCPDERVHGPAAATIARWRPLPGTDLVISLYVAVDAVGLLFAGPAWLRANWSMHRFFPLPSDWLQCRALLCVGRMLNITFM